MILGKKLTPRVSEVRKLLVSLSQHNVLEIFVVKRNIVSEISKESLKDIFAEIDGSSRIKNAISDRLILVNFAIGSYISAKIAAESTNKYIPIR